MAKTKYNALKAAAALRAYEEERREGTSGNTKTNNKSKSATNSTKSKATALKAAEKLREVEELRTTREKARAAREKRSSATKTILKYIQEHATPESELPSETKLLNDVLYPGKSSSAKDSATAFSDYKNLSDSELLPPEYKYLGDILKPGTKAWNAYSQKENTMFSKESINNKLDGSANDYHQEMLDRGYTPDYWSEPGEVVYNPPSDSRWESDKWFPVGTEFVQSSAAKGLAQWNSNLFSSLDFILPTDFLGDYDPFTQLSDYYKNELSKWENKVASDLEEYGDNKIVKGISDVTTATVAALPDLALAYMTGGMSNAAGAGSSATRLLAQNATKAGVSATLKQAVADMSKNPAFYTSMLQTMGPDYEYAKSTGANELEATLYALTTSPINAAVEVGGGIQTLPAKNKSGTSLLKNFLMSGVEEGLEEGGQKLVSGSMEKILYNPDKEVFSTTNTDAIVNPSEIGKEMSMGAAVGWILGGASTSVEASINAVGQYTNSSDEPTYDTHAIEQLGKNFEGFEREVINEGLSLDPESDAYKVAEKLNDKLESGESISNLELGWAVVVNDEQIQREGDTPSTLEEAAEAVVNDRESDRMGEISEVAEEMNNLPTETENAEIKPINSIGEVTDNVKALLRDGKRSVGVVDGQAYVSNTDTTLPSPSNTGVFIPVNNVDVAKAELGAIESDKTGANVSKILEQSDFTPIVNNPVEGTLKGVGTVRVFTDENGREIALKKDVAEYFEDYNLEATFRGGKPYAVKATDNNGNVAGVAMAVWMDESGQSYNLIEDNVDTKTNTPFNVMSNENAELQMRKAHETYNKMAKGYGQYGVQAFTNVMENVSEGLAPRAAQMFDTAYKAGLTNIDTARMTFVNDVQRTAFEAGKRDYIMENADKVANVKNVVSHGDKAGFDRTGAPADTTTEQLDIVDKLCKDTGVKGRFVDTLKGNAVLITNKGEMLIARDFERTVRDGLKTREVSVVYHAAHELAMHRLMELAPEEGRAFINALYRHMESDGDKGLAEAKRAAYAKQDVDISLSEAMEEIAANGILSLYDFDEVKFADALDRIMNGNDVQAKKGARKFKEILTDIINKLKRLIKSIDVRNRTEVQSDIDELTELRNLFETAFAKAAETNKEIAATTTISEDGVVTNAKGEVIAQLNEDGTASFSLKTYEDSGRTELNKWLDDKVKSNALTKAEANEIVEQMEYFYDICKQYENKYAPFSAWSKAEVVKGLDGKPLMSVVKTNGEYKLNLDFSLVCKKRRPLDALYRAMIDDGIMDNIAQLDAVDVARINEIIRSHGLETACTLCFVDAKRYRQYAVADAFVSKYNELVNMLAPEGTKIDRFDFSGKRAASAEGLHTMSDAELKNGINKLNKVIKEYGEKSVVGRIAKHLKAYPNDRKLVSHSDFMDSTGFTRVSQANPKVFTLYNSSKGSGGPKATLPDVQYLGDILKKSNFTPAKAYAVGGVRVQSFSDYIPRLVFDYLQMTADLTAKKLPAHAYSKEDIFVMQFGKTGIKINMSLVPAVAKDGVAPGLDKDGNYVWVDGHTFASNFHDKGSGQRGFELAIKIQNTEGYGQNCGTVAVGVSDAHIEKMLKDENIRMVIPYHKSGLNHLVAQMGNIDQYQDYTMVQNTRYKSGENAGKKITGKDFNFNEAFHRLGDAKAATEEYLAWCEKNDYLPKFDYFAYHEDAAVRENYYKTLIDFAAYDGNGNATPQGPVTMNFPTESDAFGSMKTLIEKGLEADAILEGKKTGKIPDILKEVKAMLGDSANSSKNLEIKMNEEYNGNTKHSLKWRTDLNKSEYAQVEKWIRKAGNPEATRITDNANWYKGRINGDDLFVIYSDKSTILYERRGIEGKAELDILLKRLEVIENGRSNADVSRHINALLSGDWLYEQRNLANNNAGLGGRGSITGYAPILQGKPSQFIGSQAFRNVVKNLFDIQKATEASKVSYSLKDSDYIGAVNKGDMKTAQKMVEEAAKAAGYTVKVYHGTTGFGFTKFDVNKSDDHISFFATDSVDLAGTYSGVVGETTIKKGNRNNQLNGKIYATKVNSFVDKVNEVAGEKLLDTNNLPFDDYIKKINKGKMNSEQLSLAMTNYTSDIIDRLEGSINKENDTAIWQLSGELENAILGMSEKSGNYGLYANADGFLEIDGNGAKWSSIPFDKIPSQTTANTREIVKWAKDNGYNGVLFKNIYDKGYHGSEQKTPSNVYAFFNPESQTKSADPVTYDAFGKPIPLSKRFNKNNKDIRHSLRGQEVVDVRKVKNNSRAESKTGGVKRALGAKDVDHSEQWTAERVGDKNKEPMSLSELIEKIRHDFGVNLTIGHIRGSDVRGQYEVGTKGIRTKKALDLPTIAHELGHNLDEKYELSDGLSTELQDELINNLDELPTEKYKDSELVGEGVAEYVRKFLQNRETAAIDYPKFTDHFLKSMNSKDLALIEQLADDVNAIYSLDADTATSSIKFYGDKAPDARTFSEKIKDKASVLYQTFMDANHGIKRFDVATGANTYKIAMNAAYADAIAGNMISGGDLTDANGQYVGTGFLTALHGLDLNNKSDYLLFGEYLTVKHGPERLKEGMRTFADDRKNSTRWMNNRQAEIESKHPEFVEISDRLYKFWDKFMQTWIVDTGLIEESTYDSWRERWQFYVPFNRVVNQDGITPGVKKGFANQDSPIKKARGSGRDIIHPVDNMIANMVKIINAGVKNNVMVQITEQAKELHADAAFLERVPHPMKATKVDMTGIKETLVESLTEILDTQEDGALAALGVVDSIDDILIQYGKGNARVNGKDNLVTVMKNGKPEVWKINDKQLLDSLVNMSPKTMNGILDAYAVTSRFMTANITGNNLVWSIFSNFPRDMMTLFTYSKKKNPAKLLAGMGSAYVNKFKGDNADPLYKEFLALGGGQTSVYTEDKNMAKNARKTLKRKAGKGLEKFNPNPLDWIGFVGNTIESGPRFATYKLMRENGMSPQEAFYEAMDITVNFRRGGKFSREMNKVIPFFNANMQGLDKFRRWITAEELAGKPNRKKVVAIRATSYVAVSAALAALFYGLNNGNEEDEKNYEQLSNYTKNSYWVYPLGEGQYFAIPKPREIGVLSSFFETCMEYGVGENDHAFDGFYSYATENFLPAIANDVAQIPTEGLGDAAMNAIGSTGIVGVFAYMGANRDFLGRPIVSSGLQNLEPKDQYTERTSKIAYWLGQSTNGSPEMIDYFFQQTLGGWWKTQKALFPVGGENVDYTLGVRNTYIKDNQHSTDITNWLYDRADMTARAKKSNPDDIDKSISAKWDSNMTQFYGDYYKLSKSKSDTMATRGTRQVVLDMIYEYQKGVDNGYKTKTQIAVENVCKEQNSTEYLPSVMPVEVVDGNDKKHTLSDVQYVEYQTDYLRLYWETIEETLPDAQSKAERARIITSAKRVAKEQATARTLARIGAPETKFTQKYKGVSNDHLVDFFAGIAEANGDGSLKQAEVVDVINEMDVDDTVAWALYLSKYDSKFDVLAEKHGIPADTYRNAKVVMAGMKGKDRRAKIERYLNSVCNSYKEYLFLLGMEYESIRDDYDYVMYFGKQE